MLIYFLRHGDASSDFQLHDSEQPLTNLGIHQATLVGTFLRQMNTHVDVILSSPLKRAHQTATIIQSGVTSQKPAVNELLLNGTDQQKLFQHLDALNVSSALLVGHAPHLSDTISLLVGEDYENKIEMKKCSLAVVETTNPIRPGSGQLKQLTHIDTIAKLIRQ